MKMILSAFRPTLTMLLLFTLLFGFIYPGICTVIIQIIFPYEAQGSLIKDKESTVIGSELIGQPFKQPHYFWSRLSATSPMPYNASASSGSNLGVNNPTLFDTVKERVDALKAIEPVNLKKIPVDLVTASGSGLDPEISLAAAEYQIPRVAKARHKPEEEIHRYVQRFTSYRQLGILGEPRVNVLKLNLALDGKI